MREADLTGSPGTLLYKTDPRFLSVALDWAVVLGERWWDNARRVSRGFGTVRAEALRLDEERLITAASSLAPAYLRLGGSESDRIVFGQEEDRTEACPTRLTPERWDEAAAFAAAAGLDLFVCVGAGVCHRDGRGVWSEASFRRFLNHVTASKHHVPVWELGNEVNGFPFMHGLSSWVSASRYTNDFRRFREILRREIPDARGAGPATAVWPVLGEPLPMARGVARRLGPTLDLLTWHYYPYQSSRGRVATRRVRRRTVLWGGARRSAVRMAGRMRRIATRNGSAEVWLGETGHALFGGQRGFSDRYAGSLWWLDHLGSMASNGATGLVRQALVGGEYGLLEAGTFRPRPDFWCSLLWKRVMGPLVYKPLHLGLTFRVYRHAWEERGVGMLLINTSRKKSAKAKLPAGSRGWRLEGELGEPWIAVNGRILGPDDEPAATSLPEALELPGTLLLPPASALFVQSPRAR
ncbi:MAG: hypothetical protein ACOC45_01580 [Alkalispirochaetaceae bacterium]